MNVGATKPEQYGVHIAWGETTPKREYSWYEYKLCSAGSLLTLTKYTRPDSQTRGVWYATTGPLHLMGIRTVRPVYNRKE